MSGGGCSLAASESFVKCHPKHSIRTCTNPIPASAISPPRSRPASASRSTTALFLDEHADLLDAGPAGEPRPRAEERQRRLLQHEHPPQPDERLRLPLHVLRVPVGPEGGEGVRRSRDEHDPRARAEGEGDAARRRSTSSAGCITRRSSTGTSNVVRVIHETCPRFHIKAWTAVEINWFSYLTKQADRVGAGADDRRRPGQPARRRGGDLRSRGPRPDLRAQGRRGRTGSTSTARPTSSACGPTPRCSTATSKKPRHRIDHLCRLRELQDETGGFQTFIPLAFHPENTGLDHIPKPTGLMDLRMIALSRLMLDNFDHIKAYWIMLGEKTAQVALSFGADDLDGTVVHELIYHDAGAKTPEGLTVEQLHRLIREAGRSSRRARHALSPGDSRGERRNGRLASRFERC